MKINTLQLIHADSRQNEFLAQALSHVHAGRFMIAERLLLGVVDDGRMIHIPNARVYAHCCILLAFSLEGQGAYRSAEPLYHGAVRIYDQELGFEHPVVQELAIYMYQHFYF